MHEFERAIPVNRTCVKMRIDTEVTSRCKKMELQR